MFLIELFCILLRKSCHLYVTYCKSILLNQVDYFSCVHVAIWFNHCKSFSFLGLELSSCEVVCIINDLELARINVEDRTDKDIFKMNGRVLCFFKEHFPAFEIKHFNGFIFDVVRQVVGSNKGGSGVIPFDYKHVSIIVIVRHWLLQKEKFKT